METRDIVRYILIFNKVIMTVIRAHKVIVRILTVFMVFGKIIMSLDLEAYRHVWGNARANSGSPNTQGVCQGLPNYS